MMQPTFDFDEFHPVAQNAGWLPMLTTSGEMSRELVQVTPDLLKLKPTLGTVAWLYLLGTGSLSILAFVLHGFFQANGTKASLFFGVIPLIGVILKALYLTSSVSFDSQRNLLRLAANSVPLNDIYAIQLLFAHYRAGKRRRYWYELNLILSNSERIHIMGHQDKNLIYADADRLSRFLNKPVWNTANYDEARYFRGTSWKGFLFD